LPELLNIVGLRDVPSLTVKSYSPAAVLSKKKHNISILIIEFVY